MRFRNSERYTYTYQSTPDVFLYHGCLVPPFYGGRVLVTCNDGDSKARPLTLKDDIRPFIESERKLTASNKLALALLNVTLQKYLYARLVTEVSKQL